MNHHESRKFYYDDITLVLSDTHILLEAAYTTLTHNEVVDAWSSHFPNNWHQSKGELKKSKEPNPKHTTTTTKQISHSLHVTRIITKKTFLFV